MVDGAIPSRRQSDAQLAEHERRLKAHIDTKFKTHKVDDHLSDMQKERARELIVSADDRAKILGQVQIDVARLDEDQSHVLDVVAGEKVLDEFTGQWFGEREGGIKQKVEYIDKEIKVLKERTENGGIPAKLKGSEKFQIAIVNAAALVVVAILGGVFGLFGGG